MPSKIQLTDEELQIRLADSYLDFGQVLRITPLIPYMNDAQREELMNLIAQSNKLNSQKSAAEAKYQQKLGALNLEYAGKMDQLVLQEAKYARQQYENLNTSKDNEEMANLEDQINAF